MTLEDEIAEAQSYATDPPKNESDTCDRIIMPLLLAAGYARRDIESRIADATGQFPDYTILPNAPSSTWYLEAKAWKVPLEDNHAKQALNYANHNGKRFAVLTNGHTWRFYDNSIQGMLADKLVDQASLHETSSITKLLASLTKTQVLSGGLERYAAETSECKKQQALQDSERRKQNEEEQRIHRRQEELRVRLDLELAELLSDPTSDLIQHMTHWLKEKGEFKELEPQTMALWFEKTLSQPLENFSDASAIPTQVQVVRRPVSEQSGERTHTLKAIQGIPIDGKKMRPLLLTTPDGTQIAIRSWVDMAEQAVCWLMQQARPMPIPFAGSIASRWFVNKEPVHRREDQRRKFKTISVHGKTVYMDADRPGETFLRDIYALCFAMHIPPEGFRLTTVG